MFHRHFCQRVECFLELYLSPVLDLLWSFVAASFLTALRQLLLVFEFVYQGQKNSYTSRRNY